IPSDANNGGAFGPMGAAFGPDGLFYEVDPDNNTIYRLDPQSGLLVDVFATGGRLQFPSTIAFGADGDLYVYNTGTHSVLKYDTKSGAFLGTFANASMLADSDYMVFGPDGDLYVVDDNHIPDAVYRFDGKTGAFLNSFGGNQGERTISFGPDGNAYIEKRSNGLFGVTKFNPITGANLGEFVLPGSGGLNEPYALGFGPDGNLYVASTGNSEILEYDGVTGAFLRALDTPPEFNDASWIGFSPNTSSAPVEPGLAGWTVYLDANKNGRLDPGELSTTTDADGRFTFPNLGAGTYLVEEQPPPGWTLTGPATLHYEITVSSGQNVYNVDFGNAPEQGQVVNHPPSFTSTPPTDATVGQLYR